MIAIHRIYRVYTGRSCNDWLKREYYKLFKDDDLDAIQKYLDSITILERHDDASNETILIEISRI